MKWKIEEVTRADGTQRFEVKKRDLGFWITTHSCVSLEAAVGKLETERKVVASGYGLVQIIKLAVAKKESRKRAVVVK